MKKILALFLTAYLFIGSLVPGNSFFELSETSTLLEHFQYHRRIETPGISFVDFLAMHYGNPNHEKSDPAHHSKLPMHHRANSAPADEVVYVVSNHKICSCVTEPVSFCYGSAEFVASSESTKGVFHPPQA